MTLPSFGLQYKYGSYRGPNPPAVCRGCGRSMTVGQRRDGYDRTTGERLFVRTARCSAPIWLRLVDWFWASHDFAEQDSHGDWPWVGW
jgi:hypothetical protein